MITRGFFIDIFCLCEQFLKTAILSVVNGFVIHSLCVEHEQQ